MSANSVNCKASCRMQTILSFKLNLLFEVHRVQCVCVCVCVCSIVRHGYTVEGCLLDGQC